MSKLANTQNLINKYVYNQSKHYIIQFLIDIITETHCHCNNYTWFNDPDS